MNYYEYRDYLQGLRNEGKVSDSEYRRELTSARMGARRGNALRQKYDTKTQIIVQQTTPQEPQVQEPAVPERELEEPPVSPGQQPAPQQQPPQSLLWQGAEPAEPANTIILNDQSPESVKTALPVFEAFRKATGQEELTLVKQEAPAAAPTQQPEKKPSFVEKFISENKYASKINEFLDTRLRQTRERELYAAEKLQSFDNPIVKGFGEGYEKFVNFAVDIPTGAKQEIIEKPGTAVLTIGAGFALGAVVKGAPLLGKLPFVQKISNPVTGSLIKIGSISAGTAYVGGGVLKDSLEVVQAERPGLELGKKSVGYGAAISGFKAGELAGDTIIGIPTAIREAKLNAKFKNALIDEKLTSEVSKNFGKADINIEVRPLKGFKMYGELTESPGMAGVRQKLTPDYGEKISLNPKNIRNTKLTRADISRSVLGIERGSYPGGQGKDLIPFRKLQYSKTQSESVLIETQKIQDLINADRPKTLVDKIGGFTKRYLPKGAGEIEAAGFAPGRGIYKKEITFGDVRLSPFELGKASDPFTPGFKQISQKNLISYKQSMIEGAGGNKQLPYYPKLEDKRPFDSSGKIITPFEEPKLPGKAADTGLFVFQGLKVNRPAPVSGFERTVKFGSGMAQVLKQETQTKQSQGSLSIKDSFPLSGQKQGGGLSLKEPQVNVFKPGQKQESILVMEKPKAAQQAPIISVNREYKPDWIKPFVPKPRKPQQQARQPDLIINPVIPIPGTKQPQQPGNVIIPKPIDSLIPKQPSRDITIPKNPRPAPLIPGEALKPAYPIPKPTPQVIIPFTPVPPPRNKPGFGDTPGGFLPKFPGLQLGRALKGFSKPITTPDKYSPSLESIEFNIRGRKPRIITPFSRRPIISTRGRKKQRSWLF